MANKHQALVYIQNMSNYDITNINVTHRFGDKIFENLSWDKCSNFKKTRAIRKVSYETGFGAMTSFDWWIVTWSRIEDDGHGNQITRVYSSSASLINGFSEMIRQYGGSVGSAIDRHLSRFSGKMSMNLLVSVSLLAEFIGAMWSTCVGRKIDKSEYKEFMLKAEDDVKGVTITIKPDVIEFSAASGKASTKYHTLIIDPDDVGISGEDEEVIHEEETEVDIPETDLPPL